MCLWLSPSPEPWCCRTPQPDGAHTVEGHDTCASLSHPGSPPRALASLAFLISLFYLSLWLLRGAGGWRDVQPSSCSLVALPSRAEKPHTCTALVWWDPGHWGTLSLPPSWSEIWDISVGLGVYHQALTFPVRVSCWLSSG